MWFPLAITFLTSVYFLLIKKGYRWIYILSKTWKRDLSAGTDFLKLNVYLWWFQRTNKTVAKIFSGNARKQPNKVAFYFEDDVWTYKQVEDFSNQVAHFFKAEGLKRGDTVALLLESRPEYVCIWLGLAKIGVVTALINNNLLSEPLVHSLNVCSAKSLIYGSDFTKSIKDVSSKISHLKFYHFETKSTEISERIVNLKEKLANQSAKPLVEDLAKGTAREKLMLIYTSGTTGLPKAAVITNIRFVFISLGLSCMTRLRDSDILYDPLPLYHSAGGMLGIGQCLLRGITVAIRRKFSASNFWKDCVKYKCTAAQYIGEICRYILAVHSKDQTPIEHSVRIMFGNGLKPQIWTEFVDRFKIEHVYEFYGATEGNSNLVNTDNKIGAVGFVPRYATFFYPVTLVKCNEETGEPIRNKQGFCMSCSPGEAGILVGVVNPKKIVNDFSGYADKKATEKKLISNVFTKGDLYFNSGDILVMDELGYYYFKDRIGDTFRWKGENVATNEVEAVISNLIDFKDAVVYGVEVPGTEGRAGMVAIVDTTNTLDMEKLCKGLKNNLPSYSVPIFVRVMKEVPLTGTYKLKKKDLQDEGFNVDKISDKLYFYDAKNSTYVELSKDIYSSIAEGKMKL